MCVIPGWVGFRFIRRKGWLDLVKQTQNAGATLDRLIQLEVQMGSVLDDNPAGEFMLEMLSPLLKLLERLLFLPLCAYCTDEDVGVLEIRRDIDGTDGDKWSLKLHIASYDDTKFSLDQFADSKKPEFHIEGSPENGRVTGSGQPFRVCSTQ